MTIEQLTVHRRDEMGILFTKLAKMNKN